MLLNQIDQPALPFPANDQTPPAGRLDKARLWLACYNGATGDDMTADQAPASLFERQLAACPRALFAAAAALIADKEPRSLVDLGLSAEALANAIDGLKQSSSETDEALSSLTFALASSNIALPEQTVYAEALSRRQDKDPFGEKLADFTDCYHTNPVLEGPGARAWLSCSASKFACDDAWSSLAKNPLAQSAAIERPDIFLDQAIKADELPSLDKKEARRLSPELLLALAVRMDQHENPVIREQGLDFACENLGRLADANDAAQGRALALHAIDVLTRSPELDTSASFLGSLVIHCAQGDSDLLPILARAADLMEARPSLRRDSKPQSAGSHAFLFAPDGHGGVNLPYSGEGDFPRVTLADYALAFGPLPAPQPQNRDDQKGVYSPELAALSREIAALGADAAAQARGTPAALRELAALQHRIEMEHESRGQIPAALERFALLCAANASPDAERRPVPRV